MHCSHPPTQRPAAAGANNDVVVARLVTPLRPELTFLVILACLSKGRDAYCMAEHRAQVGGIRVWQGAVAGADAQRLVHRQSLVEAFDPTARRLTLRRVCWGCRWGSTSLLLLAVGAALPIVHFPLMPRCSMICMPGRRLKHCFGLQAGSAGASGPCCWPQFWAAQRHAPQNDHRSACNAAGGKRRRRGANAARRRCMCTPRGQPAGPNAENCAGTA